MATSVGNDDFLSFVSQWNTQVTGLDTFNTDGGTHSLGRHDPVLISKSSSENSLTSSSDLDMNDDSAFEWAKNVTKRSKHSAELSAPNDLSAPNKLSAPREYPAKRERNLLSIAEEIAAVENSDESFDGTWLTDTHDKEQTSMQKLTFTDINDDCHDDVDNISPTKDVGLNNNINDAKSKSVNYLDKLKGIFQGLYKSKSETEYTKLKSDEETNLESTRNELTQSTELDLVCNQDNIDDKRASNDSCPPSNPDAPSTLSAPSKPNAPSNLSAPDILCGLNDDEFNKLMKGFDKQLDALNEPSCEYADPSAESGYIPESLDAALSKLTANSELEKQADNSSLNDENELDLGERDALIKKTENEGRDTARKTFKEYAKGILCCCRVRKCKEGKEPKAA